MPDKYWVEVGKRIGETDLVRMAHYARLAAKDRNMYENMRKVAKRANARAHRRKLAEAGGSTRKVAAKKKRRAS